VRVAIVSAAIVWSTHAAGPLKAQGQGQAGQSAPAGWVFTPSIGVAESFDSNVLLATEGSETVADFVTLVSPSAALGFRGRRSTLQADYRSSYQLYQDVSQLNAFDQRLNTAYTYRLTPGTTFYARNNLSKSPSTDELDIPGVRFRRQGVLLNDARAGFESRFNRRLSLDAAYVFQWIDFDDDPLLVIDGLRRGGNAHGGSAELGYVLSPRLSLGGEYEMRHATVDEIRSFDVMNALATVDWRLTERLALSGGAGVSTLATSVTDERRTAPAFRAGVTGSGQRFGWNVNYRRSFMPSFGFGGTFENQEFQAGLLATLTRRLDLSGSFAIRENDPLADAEIIEAAVGLRSMWARTSLSYQATRWMRLEGFYVLVLQDSQRPGGRINRNRVGIQVVAFTRQRIR
jgi:hypothetical protein